MADLMSILINHYQGNVMNWIVDINLAYLLLHYHSLFFFLFDL